jgi:hypothetical protein
MHSLKFTLPRRLLAKRALVLGVEALASYVNGGLIVSIADIGIFEYNNDWKKLFDSPYPLGSKEQWVQIASRDGIVAISTARVPQSNESNQYSGVDGLWISKGHRLFKVEVPD